MASMTAETMTKCQQFIFVQSQTKVNTIAFRWKAIIFTKYHVISYRKLDKLDENPVDACLFYRLLNQLFIILSVLNSTDGW